MFETNCMCCFLLQKKTSHPASLSVDIELFLSIPLCANVDQWLSSALVHMNSCPPSITTSEKQSPPRWVNPLHLEKMLKKIAWNMLWIDEKVLFYEIEPLNPDCGPWWHQGLSCSDDVFEGVCWVHLIHVSTCMFCSSVFPLLWTKSDTFRAFRNASPTSDLRLAVSRVHIYQVNDTKRNWTHDWSDAAVTRTGKTFCFQRGQEPLWEPESAPQSHRPWLITEVHSQAIIWWLNKPCTFHFSFSFCFPKVNFQGDRQRRAAAITSSVLDFKQHIVLKMTRQARCNVLFQDKIPRVEETEDKKQKI